MVETTRFSLEPIRATRTFEAAIEHLTEAIERAGLRSGDRLPNEGALAAELGISKPTLRQALRVLELSGLVEVRRGKAGGVFVVTDLVPAVAIFSAVKLEEDSAVDVLRARRVLERAVAHEAMRTATATDLAELGRTVDLLERHLGERSSVMRADAMFHRALVRACRNETIQAAMRGVARGLSPIRDAYSGGVAYDRQTLDVHRRQLRAIERRDEEELEAVLDEHFRMLETQFAKGIGRRWGELFGARAKPRPAPEADRVSPRRGR
jgi:GntR family transcriptional regulator, transcriptional repressor for pyruvate dehydrogenase complex